MTTNATQITIMDPQDFAYVLGPFTAQQMVTLQWMADKGYDGSIIDEADRIDDEDPERVFIGLSESSAENCRDWIDSDLGAFGTGATFDVLNKLLAFEASIS